MGIEGVLVSVFEDHAVSGKLVYVGRLARLHTFEGGIPTVIEADVVLPKAVTMMTIRFIFQPPLISHASFHLK